MKRTLFWLILALLWVGMNPLRAARLDPESEQFYQLARHFMTRDEARVFLRLSTLELRQEFIRAFWEIRDPDPATEENEFRDQIEERNRFVNEHFVEGSRRGADTSRGKVYLLLGPPTSLDEISPTSRPVDAGYVDRSYIRWIYGEVGGFYVQFVDDQGFGIFEIDMLNTPLKALDYMELGKNRLLTGTEKEIASRYLKFDAEGDPANNRLEVSIPVKELSFEQGPDGQRFARLQIGINTYLPDGSIAPHNEERQLPITSGTLQEGRLRFDIPLTLQKGANHVDVLIHDRIGDRMNRKMFAVKKKN